MDRKKIQFQGLIMKQTYHFGRNNCFLFLITEIYFVLVNAWKYVVRHSAK